MLNEAQLQVFYRLLPLARATVAREDLLQFARLVIPAYMPARHTRLVIQYLQALENRDIHRLMIFMPPRHGKSLHASVLFPAWYAGRHPDHRIILTSYGAELAEHFSRQVRNILMSDLWPFDTRLAPDSTSAARWNTVDGGGMIAAGVNGPLTGFGADLLIIDDPVKNREEADSPQHRERTWQWWQDVARPRLHANGIVLLCQTRWHEDDLAGRILHSSGSSEWTVLRLPAIAEENDPVSRQPGEVLWPERYPLSELPSVERGEISSRSWLALYQQSPTTDEGNMFRRHWWKFYDSLPQLRRVELFVDSAFKDGISADYTVIAAWGIDDNGNLYVIDLWRKRVEFPDLIDAIRQAHDRTLSVTHDVYAGSIPVVIEDAASGQSAIQVLKRYSSLPVVPYRIRTASKVARAEAVTAVVEAGRVFLPRSAPWLDDFIEEHALFPAGEHDDIVDTTSMAISRLMHYTAMQVKGGPDLWNDVWS